MLDAWKERLVFWNLNFLSTLVLDVPTTWTNWRRGFDNIRAELFQRAFLNTQVKLNKCKCNALGSIQLNKINIVILLQGSWPRDSENIYMG
jgi:hypothetical protein